MGASKFLILLKILLQFANKPTIVKRYEIANVLHSKDDIEVLYKTVFGKIIKGLHKIHDSWAPYFSQYQKNSSSVIYL